MRRIVSLVLALALSMMLFGCSKKEDTKKLEIKGPDGKSTSIEVK